MPTDSSGTPYVTDVCITSYEYNPSSTQQIATETKYCYNSTLQYTNWGIEAIFFTATIIILSVIGFIIFYKKYYG